MHLKEFIHCHGEICKTVFSSLFDAAAAPTPEYDRYILSLTMSDQTGKTWVTAFNDVAEPLLGGKTANQLHELKESGEVRGTREKN